MSAQIKDGGAVDVLADLQGVVKIAKAASLGVTGNKPRIERAEAAIAAVAKLVEATKKMQRPLAELAHNAVDAEGMMSTRPITDFATGDVGPDYIAMACSALTESVAALARVGGAK